MRIFDVFAGAAMVFIMLTVFWAAFSFKPKRIKGGKK